MPRLLRQLLRPFGYTPRHTLVRRDIDVLDLAVRAHHAHPDVYFI